MITGLWGRPLTGLTVLAVAVVVGYLIQGGMSERLRTTWPAANAYDRAVSATMPGSWLFRAAVAWVPRQLPGSGMLASPFVAAMLGYAASIAVLFVLYVLALRWIDRHVGASAPSRQMLALIAGAGAISSVVLLFTPAAPSHDPFLYAASGRLLFTYHANPYFVAPAIHPDDPILAAADYWQTLTTAYGPLWSGLSLLLAPLIGADPLRANMVYRVVALVAHLANICLIAGILGRLPVPARAWQARGLLLYAWNPLVVVEVAAGHNDVLMFALLLVGLYALARGRTLLAMVALAGAILVKATALPLVLLVLAALLITSARARASSLLATTRTVAREVGLPAVVVFVVVLVGYLPFIWGHTFAQITAASKHQTTSQTLAQALTISFNSLNRVISRLHGFPPLVASSLSQAVRLLNSPTFWTVVLGALMLAASFFLLPSLPNRERLPSAMAWVYTVWVVFLGVFHLLRTWYLVPLVGLVSLTPTGRPIRRFVLTLAASMQLDVFFLPKAPPFNGWHEWTLLLELGIPIVVLAVELSRQGFAPRAAAAHSLSMLRALR